MLAEGECALPKALAAVSLRVLLSKRSLSSSSSLGLERGETVGADPCLNVLEALQFELGLVLGGRGGLHFNVFNCLLVGFGLLWLYWTLGLLLLFHT